MGGATAKLMGGERGIALPSDEKINQNKNKEKERIIGLREEHRRPSKEEETKKKNPAVNTALLADELSKTGIKNPAKNASGGQSPDGQGQTSEGGGGHIKNVEDGRNCQVV